MTVTMTTRMISMTTTILTMMTRLAAGTCESAVQLHSMYLLYSSATIFCRRSYPYSKIVCLATTGSSARRGSWRWALWLRDASMA